MQILIGQIRERLQRSAYVNEAAISHGVVMPIINALGWDTADPQQVVPEFSISGGRVDFALFGLGHKPAVFIEVKQVGRAVAGDRQLFEYCFHQGVPLCVLTDGREWSFYLPAGLESVSELMTSAPIPHSCFLGTGKNPSIRRGVDDVRRHQRTA